MNPPRPRKRIQVIKEPQNSCEVLYNTTVSATLRVAQEIEITRSIGAENVTVVRPLGDGRIDSALKEGPFLEELKRRLHAVYPDWEIVISPPRAPCDVMINGIRINLKLTDCKSSDNCVNKPSIYYSITGLTDYPYSSNWNDFLDILLQAQETKRIKMIRDRSTEYHYLVKNKITGAAILKPIFDIHTYISNASNDLQINWRNEFASSEYKTDDANYLEKVHSLLSCIQRSVKEMIDRTKRFAEADLSSLLVL